MSCVTIKRSNQATENRSRKSRKIFIPKQKPVRRKSNRKPKHESDWRQQMEEYLEEKEEEEEEEELKEDYYWVSGYDNKDVAKKVMESKDEYHEEVEKREDVVIIGRKIVDMRVVLVGEGLVLSLLEEEVRKIKTWTTTKKIKKKANGDKEVLEINERLDEILEKGLHSRAVYKEKRERMKEGENVEDDDEDVEEDIDDKEELKKWLENERKKLEEEEEEEDLHFGISMCCFC